MTTLDSIECGKSVRVTNITSTGATRSRLLDLGVTPKTKITVRKKAPMGDPIELTLRGYELTIRLEDAKNIEVEEVE